MRLAKKDKKLKEGLMKKGIHTILAVAMTLTLLFTMGAVRPKASSLALDNYLRTPTYVAATNDGSRDFVLVYDGSDKHIKSYALGEAKTSTMPLGFSSALDLVDMTSKENAVYVIVSESGTKHISRVEIDAVDETKLNLTTLNAGVSFDFFDATKIAVDGDKLYVLSGSEIIEYFTISGDNLTLEKTILISYLTFPGGDAIPISNIEAMDDKLLIVCEDTLFSADISGSNPYALDEIFATDDESIEEISCSDTHIFASWSNVITKIDASDKSTSDIAIDRDKYTQNRSTVLGGFLYVTSTAIHKVFGIDLATDRVFTAISNAEVTPYLLESENVMVGKTNAEARLQILPYTYADAVPLTQGTHLAIIASNASFSNHYFCMVTTGKTNTYGYIEKSLVTIIEKSAASDRVMTFASETRVMKYPSLAADSTNIVIEKLPANTKIDRIFILGSEGELFTSGKQNTFSEIILADGRRGYIENSRLTIPVIAKTRAIECNAKLKMDSDLFAYDDENDVLMTVAGGTRVKIDGKLDRTKTYTKVTFNLPTGEVITGYVLTANISADSLTLLQILGIVLVGVNLIFIAVIFIIRKKLTNT